MLHGGLAGLAVLLVLLSVGAMADFRTALSSTGVDAVFPNDAAFASAAQPYNLRLDPNPAAIAYPESADDVSKCVLAAASNGVNVTARAGGHSYAANGLASNHLVVDLSRLTNVSIDPTTFLATLGAGLRLGGVAVALNANFDGNVSSLDAISTASGSASRALPHGTCPFVGLGGHALGGGFGFSARLWGLTLDNIQSAEVVLANGTIVTASSSSNPDLYWAIRGAGPSFGIVTSLTMTTHPAPSTVIGYHYDFNLSPTQAARALSIYQAFVEDAPAELGVEMTIRKGSSRGTLMMLFMGGWYGDPDQFDAVVQPFLSQMPTPLDSSRRTSYSWIDSLEATAEGQALLPSQRTSSSSGLHDTFYAKSLTTPASAPMSDASLAAFADYMANEGWATSTNWFFQVELYGGQNSTITSVPNDATAFVHRDQLFTIQFYASSSDYAPPFPAEGLAFLDGAVASIVGNNPVGWGHGSYLNYIDPRLEDWQQLYYGSNYDRLAEIKAVYDPNNVFNIPQGVTPSQTSASASSSPTPQSSTSTPTSTTTDPTPSSTTTTTAAPSQTVAATSSKSSFAAALITFLAMLSGFAIGV